MPCSADEPPVHFIFRPWSIDFHVTVQNSRGFTLARFPKLVKIGYNLALRLHLITNPLISSLSGVLLRECFRLRLGIRSTRAFVRTMDRAEIRIVCCRCFGTRWESVLDPRTILDYAPWPAKLSRNPLPPRKPAAKIGKWCDWFVSLSWRGLLWIVIQCLQRFLNIFADLMSLKRQWSAWMTGSLLIYCW